MATSTEVKNRYNKKAYKQFATKIKPALFEEIDAYREEHGLSRSEFLRLALESLTAKK